MFSQLIASRPSQMHDRRGLMFSTLWHGSVIAAAVLLTAQRPTPVQSEPVPVVPPVYLPLAPEPRPAAPAPVTQAPSPAPILPTIEIAFVPPVAVPTTMPSPNDIPWTAPTAGGPAATPGGAPGGVVGGDPAPGPAGAFDEGQVDVAVVLDQRSPLPRYPDGLRAWRLEGVARLTFVVDTLGRVEMPSVKVLESSHPAFAASVRAALPRMRFRPARIGPRAVRQLVEFPITFRPAP